jgi:hypothetical protein
MVKCVYTHHSYIRLQMDSCSQMLRLPYPFFFTELVCSVHFVCNIRETFIHSFGNQVWYSLIKYGEVFSFRQKPNKCSFSQQADWGRRLLKYKTKFLHVRTLSVIVNVNVNVNVIVNVNVNTLPHCRAACSGYQYPRYPGTVTNKCSTVQSPPLVECVCAWNVLLHGVFERHEFYLKLETTI